VWNRESRSNTREKLRLGYLCFFVEPDLSNSATTARAQVFFLFVALVAQQRTSPRCIVTYSATMMIARVLALFALFASTASAFVPAATSAGK
jgi:hypothetical protein